MSGIAYLISPDAGLHVVRSLVAITINYNIKNGGEGRFFSTDLVICEIRDRPRSHYFSMSITVPIKNGVLVWLSTSMYRKGLSRMTNLRFGSKPAA